MISEARHGPTPVLGIHVRPTPGGGYGLPPLHQTGAHAARDNPFVEAFKIHSIILL